MRRALSILFLLCVLRVSATPLIVVTNDTMFIKSYDSFDYSQFANRFACYEEAYRVCVNPGFIIRARTASLSGHNDFDDNTNRQPQLCIPYIGAMHGTNTIIRQLYCGGNGYGGGTPNSNSTYTNMQSRLLVPYLSFNKEGVRTQDWTLPTNNIKNIVYSDSAYWASDGRPGALTYSLGGSNAAIQAGVPFVDSWTGTLYLATNDYPANSNLFWGLTPTAHDHPGNEIQVARTIKTLIAEGEDTNTYTVIFDFGRGLVAQTNHCTASITNATATSISGFLRLDRMGFPVETADSSHTNDCRPAFVLQPSLSNAFCEIFRATNLPAGNPRLFIDGQLISGFTASDLSGGINFFHIYSGPFQAQKLAVLDGLRVMRDVNTTNASDDMPGNNLMTAFNSNAGTQWPINTGVDNYIAAMLPFEKPMDTQDDVIHVLAQQSTHTFQLFFTPLWGGAR